MFYLLAGAAYVLFALGFLMGSLWGRWSVAENMAKDISLLEEDLITSFDEKETPEATIESPQTAQPKRQPKKKLRQKLHIILASPYQKEVMPAFETLSKWGHEVLLLQNGQQVIDTYNQKAIDLIVLSLEMPLINGLQAASKIRDFESLMERHTPIIGVADEVDEAIHRRCSAMGLDGLWQRPFPEEELYALIEGEDEQPSEPTQRALSKSTEGGQAEEKLLTFNPKEALAHLDGNHALLNQIAQAFLREIPKRLHSIKEAIDMRNGMNLHEAAHSLKGAANCLAAGRVFCSANRLTVLVEKSKISEAGSVYPALEAEMKRLKSTLSAYLQEEN